jgi:hypothetical protein
MASKPVYTPISKPKLIFGDPDKTTYKTCTDAWNDMLFHMVVMYGDFYGNRGANTVMYNFWKFGWSRLPAWLDVCFK